jgi:glucokinase
MTLIGIDLGGTNVRAGLVRSGVATNVKTERVPQGASEGEVCDLLYRAADAVLEGDVSAIGVGVPSVVDVERGIVYNVQNIPSWQEVPLKERMERRYGVPVYVDNDANCFVAGERYYGLGKGCRNLVGLILGTGVGAGLILNGRLYAGTNCGAGEFGMIPYGESILEAYAGGQFFPRQFQTRGEKLAQRALGGDRVALSAFKEFGRHVGRAVELILFAVDPELIVLGGSVSRSFQLFQDAMWSTLQSFPYPRSLARLRIVPSELDHSGILGAAALFHDRAVDGGAGGHPMSS